MEGERGQGREEERRKGGNAREKWNGGRGWRKRGEREEMRGGNGIGKGRVRGGDGRGEGKGESVRKRRKRKGRRSGEWGMGVRRNGRERGWRREGAEAEGRGKGWKRKRESERANFGICPCIRLQPFPQPHGGLFIRTMAQLSHVI